MLCCGHCGSKKVQTVMWVEVNSEKVGDLANSQTVDEQDNWCLNCQKHCKLVED